MDGVRITQEKAAEDPHYFGLDVLYGEWQDRTQTDDIDLTDVSLVGEISVESRRHFKRLLFSPFLEREILDASSSSAGLSFRLGAGCNIDMILADSKFSVEGGGSGSLLSSVSAEGSPFLQASLLGYVSSLTGVYSPKITPNEIIHLVGFGYGF
ncbi:hypothetical protein COV20_06235 [Candidatus Woesearchaeota archaeon CG10_big_fil_rev_8_21_14_0_10_45_16]|nr:MAG: hypothetical protein COV20_06235 [Candidatus Woesearchaeota archaeon CG10_big_fil_rev_8_21_14_0_10_45_16]